MKTVLVKNLLIIILFFLPALCIAQGGLTWSSDGNSYFRTEAGDITKYTLPDNKKTVFLSKDKLKPAGVEKPLSIRSFKFSADYSKVLIYFRT